jgi:hypothetical protein
MAQSMNHWRAVVDDPLDERSVSINGEYVD